MNAQILQMILLYVVYIFGFEELLFAEGQKSLEMVEHGRIQYQLLKERSNLPKYGPCWKAAVIHIDDGCKHLSEETQSDMALHITNCFLEMSGHDTYNCEFDKKPNLRAICISSMSDRAFNVYTEFYTHTQNICWFLRGQIWQEEISENTWKVGKQLELTAVNQEGILKAQRESLELQEKMLNYGRNLEELLASLHTASVAHQDILKILSQSVNNLQSWIIGEVSWIDSVVFYMTSVFVAFLLTSSQRTLPSRLPICIMLFLNLVIERIICSLITSESNDINVLSLYLKMYDFVWYSRYGFVCLAIITFLYKSIYHTDIHFKNNEILHKIYSQNTLVLNTVDKLKCNLSSYNNNGISGTNAQNGIVEHLDNSYKTEFEKRLNSSSEIKKFNSYTDNYSYRNNVAKDHTLIPKELKGFISNFNSKGNLKNGYNLRSNSRQATPEC